MPNINIEITASDKGLEQTIDAAERKYTEFVNNMRSRSREFMNLFSDLGGTKDLKEAYEDLARWADESFTNQSESVRGMAQSLQESQISMKHVGDMMALLNRRYAEGAIVEGEYTDSMARLETLYKSIASSIQDVEASLKLQQVSEQAEGGSIDALRAKLSLLTIEYQKLDAVQRQGDEGKDILASMRETSVALADATKDMSTYGAETTETYSRIDGIVTRLGASLPQLIQYPAQFVTQLPSIVQNLNKAQEQYDAMTEAGEDSEPVWKQLIGAALNWQTALVALVPIVIANREALAEWLTVLVVGKERLASVERATKAVNKAFAEQTGSVGEQIANLKKLAAEWNSLTSEKDKTDWIEKNRDAMDSLGVSIKDTADAERIFASSENTQKVIDAMTLRAKAAVALQLASDEYAKALKKQVKAQDDAETADKATQAAAGYSDPRAAGGYYVNALFNRVQGSIREDRADVLTSKGDAFVKVANSIEEQLKGVLDDLGLSGDGSGDSSGKTSEMARNFLQSYADALRRESQSLDKSKLSEPMEVLTQEFRNKLDELERDYQSASAQSPASDQNQLKEMYQQRVAIATEAYELASKRLREQQEEDAAKEAADEAKRLADLRQTYATYEQQIAEIRQKYANERAQMYNADGTLKDGMTEGNVTNLNKSEKEAIEGVNKYFATNAEEYQRWLAEVADMTLTQLAKQLDEAEALLEVAEENGSDLEMEQLRAKIAKLKETLANQNKTSEDSKVNWTELGTALREAGRSFEDVGEKIGGVAGEMVATIGKISSSAATMVTAIGSLEASASAVEKVSLVLTAISAALEVVTIFTSAAKDNAAVMDEAALMASEYAHSLDLLSDAQARNATQTAFGADAFGRYVSNLQIAKDAQEDLAKSMGKFNVGIADSWLAKTDENGQRLIKVDMRKNWFQKTFGSKGVTYTSLGQFINEDGDLDGDALKAYYEKYSKYMSDYDKELVSSVIDDWDRWRTAMDEIASYLEGLFGNLAANISDAMVDAFIDTGDAVTDLTDVVGNYAKTLAKSLIQSKLINTYFNQTLTDEVSALIANGNVAGAIARIKETADKAMSNEGGWVNELLQGVGDAFGGWGESASSSSSATAKGIAQASQDSVDELNGRMTAIQTHTYELNANVRQLVASGGETLTAIGSILSELGNLDAIRDSVGRIERHTSDITTKGVKML